MSDATPLPDAIHQGDAGAAEELLPLIYEELRKLAAHKMAGEAAGHTLQATALVHEAWLRLTGDAAALFVAGCASTVQYVPMPDQSKAVEDSAKGRIYLFRPAGAGGAVGMNVSDSGSPIGKTGPKGYLCWERQPGDAVVSSSAENVSRVSVPVRPGSIHYIFQHLRMGIWIARNELEVVSEEEGKKQLKKCKPAKYQPQ